MPSLQKRGVRPAPYLTVCRELRYTRALYREETSPFVSDIRGCAVRPIGFISHPEYLKHDTGRRHPEEPARLSAIIRHLESSGTLGQLVRPEPVEPDLDWLALAHTPDYIRGSAEAC